MLNSLFTVILLTAPALADSTVVIERVSASHRTITTSIVIDAPREEVWAVLTDFERMPEWSDSLQTVTGDIRDGGAITMYFKSNPKRDKVGEYPQTLILKEGESFGWTGQVFAAGMTDKHFYTLVDQGDGTTLLVHSDEARGGMTWLLGGVVMGKFEGYCTSFNEALKARVESGGGS